MTVDTSPEAAETNALREALVDELRERREIRSDRVANAFRAVPRHRFAPEATSEEAYANDVVVTKKDEHGKAVSSVSAPWVQAEMLEQSGLGPGMRALEIGSGGYNAALMAELVGEDGEVVTVDIDPYVTDRARRFLAETGYKRVTVLEADGAYGGGDHTPADGFDAVIVTVGAADVPADWADQLASHGRLVVPLRLRGLTRSICFERENGHLVSRAVTFCGFVSMRGAAAATQHTVQLRGDDVRLKVDEDQQVDDDALRAAFSTPRHEVWTGVTLAGNEGVLPAMDLWLASALASCGRFYATAPATEEGVAGWVLGAGSTAVWSGDSFAYMTLRHAAAAEESGSRFELGVIAHGPGREALADQLAERVRFWDQTHRPGPVPVIRAYPAGTPDGQLHEGRAIDKRHTRLVLSWT